MLCKKPLQIVATTALLLTACVHAASADETRHKLGLMVGEKQDRRLDSQILTAATDAFFSSRRFTVIERRKLDAVFTEQDLQNFLGNGDANLSDILGLEFLAIIDYSLELQGPDRIEVFYITARLVNVKTGEISATIRSRIDSLVPATTPRIAGQHLLTAIRTAFPPMGYVINVSGGSYIVDLGAEVGIQQGDQLEVLREGEQIIGMNGKAMAPIQNAIGTLKVTTVRSDHAICKSKSPEVHVVRGDLVRLAPKISKWKSPLRNLIRFNRHH